VIEDDRHLHVNHDSFKFVFRRDVSLRTSIEKYYEWQLLLLTVTFTSSIPWYDSGNFLFSFAAPLNGQLGKPL